MSNGQVAIALSKNDCRTDRSDRCGASIEQEWFAIYTSCRHEKRVAEHFRCKGIESFLPLYKRVSRWKDCSKNELELPLFPNYIFARFHSWERVRVLETSGVVSIVGNRGGSTAVPQSEIDSLRAAAGCGRLEPHPHLAIGEQVRIIAGPMMGFQGILLRKKSKWRVICSLELISQNMAVEVNEEDVAPLRTASKGHMLFLEK